MKYSPLKAEDVVGGDGLADRYRCAKPRHPVKVLFLCFALLASLGLNALSFSKLIVTSSLRTDRTNIAGLRWDTPLDIQYNSPFNDPNRTIEDEAWSSSLVDPATMVVALDDSFTESKGVSHSMRWPWDADKGVYTLNSAHELHCLHLLRKTINEAYDDKDLSWPRSHSAHCLEYLLQNVLCHADDTLLYQGLIHQNKHAAVPIGGLGDTRMCRSWSQLQDWARTHSACYNPYVGKEDPSISEVERYKFCPNGEEPWKGL